MKKWTIILSLSVLLTLFLTGCQSATDTAGEMESSFPETELVENTETDVIEKSEIPEEISEEVSKEEIEQVSEEVTAEASEEVIEEISEEVTAEVSEEITQDDTEESSEEETTAEEVTESDEQHFFETLEYTITVLDEHMDITDEVPASELVTLQCEIYEWDDESALFFAYVEDGKLYYLREINRGYLHYSGENGSMETLPEISNIRRMITVNVGSGVEPMPVLITESGEVYMLYNTWPLYSDEMELVRFTPLKDYQVDNIIYFNAEWSYYMKVLLKDGSVIELRSESWG